MRTSKTVSNSKIASMHLGSMNLRRMGDRYVIFVKKRDICPESVIPGGINSFEIGAGVDHTCTKTTATDREQASIRAFKIIIIIDMEEMIIMQKM